MLLLVVSFEAYLFGATMLVIDEGKCTTTTIPVGGKCTLTKNELS